jgi:hypothetical protein
MKNYSNNSVTPADLETLKAEAQATAVMLMDAVDTKQAKQINFLRIALAGSFIVNVLLTIGLKYFA